MAHCKVNAPEQMENGIKRLFSSFFLLIKWIYIVQPLKSFYISYYSNIEQTNKLLWSYVADPFKPKSPIFWSLFLFANLVCPYVRKITYYLVQPNNSANIRLKNPDIRIKRIIRSESWIRFLLKRIQECNLWYPVDKKPNTFLNY